MENELPFDIARYLYGQWTERNYFSYIATNRQGELLNWNEDIKQFYNLDLNKEQIIDEQIMSLLGFFPYEEDDIFILDFVNFDNNRTANIHIVPTDDEVYILFFDATEAANLRQELQQTYNELQIAHQKEVRAHELLEAALLEQKQLEEKNNALKDKELKVVQQNLKLSLNQMLMLSESLVASDAVDESEQAKILKTFQQSSKDVLQFIDKLSMAS